MVCGIMASMETGSETKSEQLAAFLKRRIALGELKPGDRLPGVRQLARMCGTSVRVSLVYIVYVGNVWCH